MRSRFPFHGFLLLLVMSGALASPAGVEAQLQPDPIVTPAAWAPMVAVMTVQEPGPSFERVLLGSALGTVAGAAVGTAVAVLVWVASDPPAEAMFGPLGELVVIGLPITAVGTGIGTYLGSQRQANPWLTGAAAVAGVGLGAGLGVLVGDAVGPGAGEYIGGTVGSAIAITLPALVGWATAR